MPVITARLLGPPRIAIDSNPPPPELLWRKPLALCVVLWSAPERQRSRDQLLGLLWSDKTEKAARHSLNEALRIIRRAAGADAISTASDDVRWGSPPQLDTDRFTAIERDDPAGAADLVTGPFCDGLVVSSATEFESWLFAERQRWQARSINVLVRANKIAEDRGDAGRARELAERAMAINPHSDLAAQALIRAHWLCGDRAAALAAGETYRLRLDEELGTALDERTAALIARVARERHPARPAGSPEATQRSRLIGRELALQHLLTNWRANTAPVPARLFVITGTVGSGRSRLLDELVVRARMTGATVATMRAVDSDQHNPDAAVMGLARSGLEGAPGSAAAPAAALATFVARIPAWAEQFRGVAAADTMPAREAFAAIAHAIGGERPVVLAIDDADRLHPDELLWFPALLRDTGNVSVTLLLTGCTGSGNAAMDELTRRLGRDIPGAAERLEALSAAEIRQLVDWAVAAWPDDARDRLARRVWTESAGLPAIAIEVLHAVQHGMALDSDSAWPPADRTLDATLPAPLPEPLVAAVRLAFRRLSVDAQNLLTAAALHDEPFSAGDVGRTAGIDDASRRDAALDALEWEQWIVADGRGYSFPARAKRRLIARDMITPGQRRRIEERIAARS